MGWFNGQMVAVAGLGECKFLYEPNLKIVRDLRGRLLKFNYNDRSF